MVEDLLLRSSSAFSFIPYGLPTVSRPHICSMKTKYIPHPTAGTLGSETRNQLTLIDLAKTVRLSKMGWIKVAEAEVEFWFIIWQDDLVAARVPYAMRKRPWIVFLTMAWYLARSFAQLISLLLV